MKIIFHIPWEIKKDQFSATAIRPVKIIEAMKAEGHEVSVIWGKGAERRRLFKDLIKRIKDKEKFELVYSEASTAPNFLASGLMDGLLYGLMDHFYLWRLKQMGLPIGLFYRDLYWVFPSVMRSLSLVKRIVMYTFYWVDLLFYKKYLKKIFFPSGNMHEFFPWKTFRHTVLPPGLESTNRTPEKKQNSEVLELFYVGGLSVAYDMKLIFQAINKSEDVKATICVRETEWAKEKSRYLPYLNPDKITIIHKQKKELEPFLNKADVGILFLKPEGVRVFMLPAKVFEYMEYGLSILSAQGTIAGKFIEEEDVGWNIPYDSDSIEQWLNTAKEKKANIRERKMQIMKRAKNHTWQKRVQRIISELKLGK
jgi:glycosyltransferase involved in cell wall biosynthesis